MRLSTLLEHDNDVHAQLRMKIGRYRSYERDTTSGGGSTSGAGGSSTPTTESGGSSTPTSGAQGAHSHMVLAHAGAALAPAAVTTSKYLARKSAGTDLALNVDAASADSVDLFTREAASSHQHSVSIGSHDHSVTIGTHQHSTPNHQHVVVKDIYEDSPLPGPVSVFLDGQLIDSVIGGPFTATATNNTFDVSLTGIVNTAGWHRIRFETTSGLGRVTPYLILKSLSLN